MTWLDNSSNEIIFHCFSLSNFWIFAYLIFLFWFSKFSRSPIFFFLSFSSFSYLYFQFSGYKFFEFFHLMSCCRVVLFWWGISRMWHVLQLTTCAAAWLTSSQYHRQPGIRIKFPGIFRIWMARLQSHQILGIKVALRKKLNDKKHKSFKGFSSSQSIEN